MSNIIDSHKMWENDKKEVVKVESQIVIYSDSSGNIKKISRKEFLEKFNPLKYKYEVHNIPESDCYFTSNSLNEAVTYMQSQSDCKIIIRHDETES